MKKTIAEQLKTKEYPIIVTDSQDRVIYLQLDEVTWLKYNYKETKFGDTKIKTKDNDGDGFTMIVSSDDELIYVRNDSTNEVVIDVHDIEHDIEFVYHENPRVELEIKNLYDLFDITYETRDVFTWGTYGKNGDQPLKHKLLKDMTNEHIIMILATQRQLERSRTQRIFMNELNLRFKHPELSISENA